MKIIKLTLFILIITVGLLFIFVDDIAKTVVENQASKTLSTDVRVGSINSSFSEKYLKINNLEVTNPAGFKSQNALKIKRINIQLGSQTNGELLIIENLDFDDIIANLEQSPKGINIKILADGLEPKDEDHDATSNHSSSEDGDTKIIIKNFTIKNSKIFVNTDIFNEKMDFPNITLKNIGGENGVNAKNIGTVLVKILLDEIQNAVKKKGLDMAKDKLKENLTRKISEKIGLDPSAIDDIKQQVADKFKNIFKF